MRARLSDADRPGAPRWRARPWKGRRRAPTALWHGRRPQAAAPSRPCAARSNPRITDTAMRGRPGYASPRAAYVGGISPQMAEIMLGARRIPRTRCIRNTPAPSQAAARRAPDDQFTGGVPDRLDQRSDVPDLRGLRAVPDLATSTMSTAPEMRTASSLTRKALLTDSRPDRHAHPDCRSRHRSSTSPSLNPGDTRVLAPDAGNSTLSSEPKNGPQLGARQQPVGDASRPGRAMPTAPHNQVIVRTSAGSLTDRVARRFGVSLARHLPEV